MSTTEINLADTKLASSREYREAFVASFLKRYIPFQIRTIRKKRGMSQPALALEAKITQGVISRAEDPDYGNLTFNTVLRIAAGFDLAFVGKFVRFSEFQKIIDEMSEDALDLPGFAKECELETAVVQKHSGADISWLGNSGDVAAKIAASGGSRRYDPTGLGNATPTFQDQILSLRLTGMNPGDIPEADKKWLGVRKVVPIDSKHHRSFHKRKISQERRRHAYA